MARVKCVMMQKDETLLLESWFRYYGYMFGFENLVVFDNGSVDKGVIQTLKLYEAAGCRVLWEFTRMEDFHAKGAHFKNIMHQWDWQGQYDFAIPVDVDEFIVAHTVRGLSCRKSDIHSELDRLIGQASALRLNFSFFNVPKAPNSFKIRNYPKSFLPSDSVEEIDHGFHACKSKRKPGVIEARLAYLHYHNKPFEMLKRAAALKLNGFTDVSDLKKLRNYSGPGLHLVPYFFMDENQYIEEQSSGHLVELPAFSNLMRGLGGTSEFLGTNLEADVLEHHDLTRVSNNKWAAQKDKRLYKTFDGKRYLDANLAVKNAPEWNPLVHYLLAGADENRPLE